MDTPMRTGRDRLRYTISFELLLMALLVPVGAIYFDKALHEIGALGLILSLKAMAINLVYNWVFDRVDARAGRISSDRSAIGRIMHATGFELTLLVTSLPIYMWWLQLGLIEAIATDLTVTTFVVFYTYLFTLGYDRLFPVRAVA
ncbi:PACE efflux transporter [Aliiroseovarius marinus]|uniref:PACE efflux transporter n=1 Tax=Aliiroseovarius marinus TaxID=2500159 RepID=UPI0010602042|nr:PACE efflux transporter [Aliiroseovarius marinus]